MSWCRGALEVCVCCLHVTRFLGKLEEQQLFAHARHEGVGQALVEFCDVCRAVLSYLACCKPADYVLPGFSRPGTEGPPGRNDEVGESGPNGSRSVRVFQLITILHISTVYDSCLHDGP